jgi:hypothetical protein
MQLPKSCQEIGKYACQYLPVTRQTGSHVMRSTAEVRIKNVRILLQRRKKQIKVSTEKSTNNFTYIFLLYRPV